jgi:hypothetical protein
MVSSAFKRFNRLQVVDASERLATLNSEIEAAPAQALSQMVSAQRRNQMQSDSSAVDSEHQQQHLSDLGQGACGQEVSVVANLT